MKKLILISLVAVFLTSMSMFGEVPYYVLDTNWSSCYQIQMASCTDCTSQLLTETINYLGCPCDVTYKISTCNCPEERTFVEILYIRVNISTPPPCVFLVNLIHPDFPNLDMNNYRWLESQIYDNIIGRLFVRDSSNYHCPDTNKSFSYFEASCKMVCTVGLSAPGQPEALLWLPKYCTPTGCCTTQYEYCVQTDGSIFKRVTMTGDQVCEGTEPSEPCPNPGTPTIGGDHIIIGGIDYTVTWVNATECSAICYPPEQP